MKQDKWKKDCTLCHACGTLFEQNKYCPVCKGVWRDSETTVRMVHPVC